MFLCALFMPGCVFLVDPENQSVPGRAQWRPNSPRSQEQLASMQRLLHAKDGISLLMWVARSAKSQNVVHESKHVHFCLVLVPGFSMPDLDFQTG